MTSQVIAVMVKDLTLERRSKASLNALIFFGALILLIVSFALGPDLKRLQSVAGAVVWISFAFAGVLAFARAYQTEEENRCFEGMLLAGAEPKAIYLGKMASTLVVMGVVEVSILISMAVLYNLSLWGMALPLAAILCLGTIGLVSIGVLYGRLAMSLRAREVLLPLLVLPVVIPAVLACVKATDLVLSQHAGSIGGWLELLVVFDIVFLTCGLLTYETLCRE